MEAMRLGMSLKPGVARLECAALFRQRLEHPGQWRGMSGEVNGGLLSRLARKSSNNGRCARKTAWLRVLVLAAISRSR